jgi:hypothetical protein
VVGKGGEEVCKMRRRSGRGFFKHENGESGRRWQGWRGGEGERKEWKRRSYEKSKENGLIGS